jgi:hypothetical protein
MVHPRGQAYRRRSHLEPSRPVHVWRASRRTASCHSCKKMGATSSTTTATNFVPPRVSPSNPSTGAVPLLRVISLGPSLIVLLARVSFFYQLPAQPRRCWQKSFVAKMLLGSPLISPSASHSSGTRHDLLPRLFVFVIYLPIFDFLFCSRYIRC